MSAPMKPDDPAYWMLDEGLRDPGKRSVQTAPYRDGCFICEDPEFALMGLPLCWACEKCGGHVAADDTTCDDYGHDHHPLEVDEAGELENIKCRCKGCINGGTQPESAATVLDPP